MFTPASPSLRLISPSSPGRSATATTATSSSAAISMPAPSSAPNATAASSTSTCTSDWPPPLVTAQKPSMLTPASPSTCPSLASSPGSSSRYMVKSVAMTCLRVRLPADVDHGYGPVGGQRQRHDDAGRDRLPPGRLPGEQRPARGPWLRHAGVAAHDDGTQEWQATHDDAHLARAGRRDRRGRRLVRRRRPAPDVVPEPPGRPERRDHDARPDTGHAGPDRVARGT